MQYLRWQHAWLFWCITGLALCTVLAAPLHLLALMVAGSMGLGPEGFADYGLRPFPLGGLQVQLLAWHAIVWTWVIGGLGAALVLWRAWRTEGSRPAVDCCPASGPVWRAYAAGLLAMTAIAGAYLAQSRYIGLSRATPMVHLEGLRAVTGIDPPPGTVLVQAWMLGGMWKPFARATVLVPRHSVRRFLSSEPFEGHTSTTQRPQWRQLDREARRAMNSWRPEGVRWFVAASGENWTGSDVEQWRALADLSGRGHVTVFVEYWRY